MTKQQARTLDRQVDAVVKAMRKAGATHVSQTRMEHYDRAQRKAVADGERVRRELGMESLAGS